MNIMRFLRASALSPLYLMLAIILFMVSVPVGLIASVFHQIFFDGEDSLETAVFQYAGRVTFLAAWRCGARAVHVWQSLHHASVVPLEV